ncbi:MAG: hypothetical protein IJ697_04330 [Synergistaceae bacterium]|nr:hypothetical protein [Synergistaceae bacterium]
MFKRFTAGIFLLSLLCGVSSAAEYDPFSYQFWFTSPDYEASVYKRYGNGSYNFFYQLRDITGSSRNEKVGGPQWFATVYENSYYALLRRLASDNSDLTGALYRRTMGGGMPAITLQTVGDLLDGFNYVFIDEPQPYNSAWRRYIFPLDLSTQLYDVYPDPLESLCLVITNGTGEFNIDFGNPYARHFPFVWGLRGTTPSRSSTKWWLEPFVWQNETFPTLQPIAYVYSSPDIYVRDDSVGRYNKGYTLTVSDDNSTRIIKNLSNSKDYFIVSGDNILTSRDALFLTVNESRDKIYDASGKLAYTIETDTNGDMFICTIRDINSAVEFSGFDSDYSFVLNPANEQVIPSAGSLSTNVRIRGITASDYGSKLGYLTFKQRASFAVGYENYREFASLPLVIANVADGNASVAPLIFDMIVFDENYNSVINRIKFEWDAQADKTDQDLGTFFMIGSRDVTYRLETRITNRSGTRYELYRYDMTGARGSNPTYRDGYSSIMPDCWKYDLTPDLYGTLPDSFLLDAHSQIAPGLVTVYRNNIGEGYSTINTGNDTTESFRLYEYSETAPKNLRLKYKRVGGMTAIEDGIHIPASGVRVQEFSMAFADVAQNSEQTTAELTSLMGKYPSMIERGPLVSNPDLSIIRSSAASEAAEVKSVYINSSALDAFSFTKPVPLELVRLISEDTGSNQTTSRDNSGTNNNNNSNGNGNNNTTSGDNTASFTTSAVKFTSVDIALQPVSVRMGIPRQSQLIVNHWNELDNASNSRELFTTFAKYGTVYVRSEATAEKDADLFAAINNKGASLSVSAADCVRAFIYDDELYLDFIVLLADGKSRNANRTAYVEVFKDDNVPYILIGDGKENAVWDMTFYVAPIGQASSEGGSDSPEDNTDNGVPSTRSSGGGGGCNSSGMILAAVLLGISGLKAKR